MLDPDGITFFCDCYLPGRTTDERRDPAVSPAFADLHGLPPAFMSVGTSDHLLDDTLLLATRWRAAGNPVSLFVAPDMPHGFQAFPCGITKACNAAQDTWLAEVLATGPPEAFGQRSGTPGRAGGPVVPLDCPPAGSGWRRWWRSPG